MTTIPPDIKAAIEKRAREIAGAAPPVHPPIFDQWMRETFIPAYLKLMAERERGA